MYEIRLNVLRQLLVDHKLDAALVTSVPNITYLTGYAGFSLEEREAFLLITQDKQFLLTDGRYTTAIRQSVPHFTLVEISSRHTFKKAFQTLVLENHVKKLGIEENNLFVYEYKTISSFVKETMHVPAGQMRIRKAKDEISAISEACKIGDAAFNSLLSHIQPGISEKKLAYKIEDAMRVQDAEPSFRTIVAFNANAAIPHHMTGENILAKIGLILIDSGVKYQNYCSDMTRTVFLGKVPQNERKIYQTVLDAQQKAAEYIQSMLDKKQPVSAMDADRAAREYILSQGFPTIPHSLGHGIGLEVHEAPTLSPVSQQTLENGMVFSIEPGIYLPGEAGVRIEDLFVIEGSNLRQLTTSPKNLTEL